MIWTLVGVYASYVIWVSVINILHIMIAVVINHNNANYNNNNNMIWIHLSECMLSVILTIFSVLMLETF